MIIDVTPKPDTSIDAVKARMWNLIKNERDTRELDSGVFVSGKWFHCDTSSQIKYQGLEKKANKLLSSGGDGTTPITILSQQIQWRTMDNTFAPMTVQLALDIVAAIEVLQATLHYVASIHRSAMEALIDPATYNFSAGWPAKFSQG